MVRNNTASKNLIVHRPFLKWLPTKMKWKSIQNFLSTCLRQFWLIFVWSMLFHNIRSKELAKRVKISLASHAANWISYSQEIARKHLALNWIRMSKEYNVALEDIHIGEIHSSPQCLCLWCLSVYKTHFRFHALIYSHAETPVYFHPSPMKNSVPATPWGYFSHDPNPTSNGEDSLMEPWLNASEDVLEAYISTLAGVGAVV